MMKTRMPTVMTVKAQGPPGVACRRGGRSHHFLVPLIRETARGKVFRTMMMTNSTTPVAKRAWRCSPAA